MKKRTYLTNKKKGIGTARTEAFCRAGVSYPGCKNKEKDANEELHEVSTWVNAKERVETLNSHNFADQAVYTIWE